jgi:hypothetical protein
MGDLQGQRYQPGPAADRADLVTILAPQAEAILAWLSSRSACSTAPRPMSWACRARDRRICILGHPASHRAVDRSAGPQPHGPRRQADQVKHDSRPRLKLTAFDAVLGWQGPCLQHPDACMNVAERWIGGYRREF